MMNNGNILEVTSLAKQYRSGASTMVEVFHDVSFTVAEGEIVALTGASGSGKTTLLNIIGTLDSPTGGTVTVKNTNIATLSGVPLSAFRNEHIGFIFQFHHLLPEFSALENVAMPALIAGWTLSKASERANELLGDVGLSHRRTHRPSELSGGEAQRVAVARAFMMQPDLVLADEPTGNLDPDNAEKLFAVILSLASKHKQTFVIATHNIELARGAARTLHLEKGTIAE
ncbi:MAG TPA: ABC transporter ATP-binding protein [Candidatus Kapabacteria bacterium]|nr:ABC transporter ATP-binding protein [Candidatus Kapabacteria bacterium]